MNLHNILHTTLVGLLLAINAASVSAEDNNNDDGAAATDDNTTSYYQQQDDDDKADAYSGGDDFIKYWTEYAVLPKKCINLGGKDVIVFSMYEKYYNHCADKAIGTYSLDVPTFMTAYAKQLELNADDMTYGDDYTVPDSTYVTCYPYEINGVVFYVQMGCTDGTSQSLSVNVYKDNTCTEHDRNADGIDDTTIDVSDLQAPFGQCTSCVHFVDKNEDDVDDGYFEGKTKNAPLCEATWEYKESCGRKCRKMGNVKTSSEWNSSDKLLLFVLGSFSTIMMAVITKKRGKMSRKDALLEEAALGSVGIQQSHVVGIFALTFFFIFCCGLAGWKGLTWTLLLSVSLVLFGYLMKLTIDAGMNVPLGPDGEPLDNDSSDDEDDDEEEDGYKAPATVNSPTEKQAEKEAELPSFS